MSEQQLLEQIKSTFGKTEAKPSNSLCMKRGQLIKDLCDLKGFDTTNHDHNERILFMDAEFPGWRGYDVQIIPTMIDRVK